MIEYGRRKRMGAVCKLFIFLPQVVETSDFVVRAGNAFQEVGGHALSLGQRVMQMGMDLGEVLKQAGKDIYNAGGLRKD
ncbi:hypothetical protein PoB_006503000 [Plakobranchus ocellatus]|uniref:Uncharacterized protein n=1 Tax=Plakobranchus ocellatus TaxID=259542 RepID=A0AAV4D355_9GAST|nr:hypothetical protein PoB_006503000 [Plakobranchus ocellatus]